MSDRRVTDGIGLLSSTNRWLSTGLRCIAWCFHRSISLSRCDPRINTTFAITIASPVAISRRTPNEWYRPCLVGSSSRTYSAR